MLAHDFFPVNGRKTRILDLDIENRPLSYWMDDRPTCEITAIASQWVGSPRSMQVLLLGIDDPEYMLTEILHRYMEADLVTGHYIRRHDLPIINGALYEYGLPLLVPKWTCDTKLDMFTKADIPATQEFLCETLGCPIPKVHMTQTDWREANRLTPRGLEKTRKRVTTDVQQHMWLREEMLQRGMLRPISVWNPGGGEVPDERRYKR